MYLRGQAISKMRGLLWVLYVLALIVGVYYVVLPGVLYDLGLDVSISPDLDWLETKSLGNTPATLPSQLFLCLFYTQNPEYWSENNIVNYIRFADKVLYVCVFFISQWVIVHFSRGFTIHEKTNRPPRLAYAGIAGFWAMLLTLGAIATILEIPNWWFVISIDWFSLAQLLVFAGIMLVLWLASALVLFSFCYKESYFYQLKRFLRGLITASLFLMLLAALVQSLMLFIRDASDARGSYTGLVFGATALLWGTGVSMALRPHIQNLSEVSASGSPVTSLGGI